MYCLARSPPGKLRVDGLNERVGGRESFGIRKGLMEGVRIGLEVEVVVLMLLGVEM